MSTYIRQFGQFDPHRDCPPEKENEKNWWTGIICDKCRTPDCWHDGVCTKCYHCCCHCTCEPPSDEPIIVTECSHPVSPAAVRKAAVAADWPD